MLRLRSWVRDDRGATAIEYAILAGFVSCAIMVSVHTLGGHLGLVFTSVVDALDGTPPPPAASPNAFHGGS